MITCSFFYFYTMEKISYQACAACDNKDIRKVMDVKDHSISQESFEVWECASCALRFTQNVPSPENIAPYYKSEEYISHSDTKKGIVNNLYHRVRTIMLDRKFRLVAKYSQTKQLLDYGAGTGYFPAYVQSKKHPVTAIEIDPDARSYAKEKFGLEVLSPEVLEDGTLDKNQFDVISLWHVMEHLYNPKTYAKRFHELLMTNGHLIVAVPNYTSSDATYYQNSWAAYDVPRHLWHFSPASMKEMIESQGFTLVEKKGMPFDSFYVSLLSEKYKNGKSSLFGGFRRGFSSYSKSRRDVDRCSSIIYVFRKN